MRALVLGGGGAKGFAHIPLLETLSQAAVRPDLLVGTSIGALVGALWIHGSLDDFREEAFRASPRHLLALLDPRPLLRGAMLGGRRLEALLTRFLPATLRFEDLAMPLAVVAVDLVTGRPVCFHRGPVFPAVRASIGLPGLLPPVACGAQRLVDGGVLEPLPLVAACELGARRIAAVTLVPPLDSGQCEGCFPAPAALSDPGRAAAGPRLPRVLARSLDLALGRLTGDALAAHPPELVLAPQVARIGLLDFHRSREAWEAGRALVASRGEALLRLFSQKKT